MGPLLAAMSEGRAFYEGWSRQSLSHWTQHTQVDKEELRHLRSYTKNGPKESDVAKGRKLQQEENKVLQGALEPGEKKNVGGDRLGLIRASQCSNWGRCWGTQR